GSGPSPTRWPRRSSSSARPTSAASGSRRSGTWPTRSASARPSAVSRRRRSCSTSAGSPRPSTGRRGRSRVRRVAVLCGGFGAARFLDGLRRVPDVELTCIANTADDLEYAGVHVSPDVDTVSYALAGIFDEGRGFGIVGDTFRNAEALRRYGWGWFSVGDVDLATSIRRTDLLRAGATLSEATASLVQGLGVAAAVLPMSDDPVRTVVVTDEGRLAFQEYLVARRAQPAVRAVEYDGLAAAAPAPAVLPALAGADLVILAPSSPVASLGPILGLPGVRPALAAARVVA